jgi:hypothetical protein
VGCGGDSSGNQRSGAEIRGKAGTAISLPRRTMGDHVMFMQIIEFRTSDIERVRRTDEEWLVATEGKRTVRRQLLARDRSDPGRYFAVVFFDSYESAMENNSLPETQVAAEQYMKLSDGPPVFYDLDIIDERA